MKVNILGTGKIRKGFRAKDVDVSAGGMEDRVVGIQAAVAGGDAAERLVGGIRNAHGHAVGKPCAATHEKSIRAAAQPEESGVIERGCPPRWAGRGIADLAIGGESEV